MFLTGNNRTRCENVPLDVFLKGAMNKALKSKTGHLDLFLRFLHGISLESNQRLLQDVLILTENNPEIFKKITQNLKRGQKNNISPERWMNLTHCLIEMKDNSVVEEVQVLLKSETRSKSLSLAQCSTLANMILMSEEVLDEFNLNRYNFKSKEGRIRLIPAVRNCRKAVLTSCNFTDQHCEMLASALQSSNSTLRELDLSNNDLQDSGVKLLCAGFKSPNCQLNILRLSGCMVTEEGCAALASALSSNPSHLRQLDLSYNHPGDSGVKLLSDTLKHLDKLNVDHGGEFRIRAGPQKYACDLTLDPNTAHRFLVLSEENRKVTCVKELQNYPKHPDRFDVRHQVLCSESLTGRCYWETEWSGKGVHISVCYKEIKRKGLSPDCVFGAYRNSFQKEIQRKGWSNDCWFGYNDISWSLECSDQGFTARHNNNKTEISVSPDSCKRVSVFLDESSGSLSFYSVSDTHTLTHLHTFTHTFTQPLHAGFNLYHTNSSVSLCHIKH